MWLCAGVAVVVAGALVVVLLGVFSRTVLDNAAVANGVRTSMTTNYGVADADIQEVSCPADEPIEPGHRFACTAVIGGERKTITITVRTKAGEYEVAHP